MSLMRNNKRGFTLIELLMILAAIGFVGSAIPIFYGPTIGTPPSGSGDGDISSDNKDVGGIIDLPALLKQIADNTTASNCDKASAVDYARACYEYSEKAVCKFE